jgi:hypothetical protein
VEELAQRLVDHTANGTQRLNIADWCSSSPRMNSSYQLMLGQQESFLVPDAFFCDY